MQVPARPWLPYFMWFFPLMFFSYQFILRLWPGLMMEPIFKQFSIDASDFGILASSYYFGYAGMQIPVAILLEKYSTKWIVFLSACLCGLAMYLFSYTDSFTVALISRFLIGAGSAVGFLGVSKVVSDWFPKTQYASLIGFSFTIGLCGAIFGGRPVSMLIQAYGWQTIAFALSLVAILIGFGCLLTLRSPKIPDKHVPKPVQLSDFKSILASPYLWWLALVNLLLVGSLEGFADVWGIPFLMTALDMPKTQAAWLVSFIFFGMLVGGPLLAFFSKGLGNYLVIAVCGLGITIIFIALLLNVISSHWILGFLFLITGILSCYQVLIFAAGSDIVDVQYLGITVAFLNCINMLGGSFFHSAIGYIMDYFWQGVETAQGMKIYDLPSFQYALAIIPISALFGSLITWYIAKKIPATQTGSI